MTEKQMDAQVRKTAKEWGLPAYHTLNSFGSAQGFPDWVVIGTGGRMLYAELKTDKGRLSDMQASWIRNLIRSKQRAYVVRGDAMLSEFLTLMIKPDKASHMMLAHATDEELLKVCGM